MKIKIVEQNELRPAFDPNKIAEVMNPWENTRSAVARACKELFPESFIYIGGHHVAVHNPLTGNRMLLITTDSPDFN